MSVTDVAGLELTHLRYFVVLAEELHFGRAAGRLHISQPPLTQQIQRLEARVGHALLHRTSRRVELTAAGRVFHEAARAVLQEAQHALDTARRVGPRRGWPPHAGHTALAHARHAAARHPPLPRSVPGRRPPPARNGHQPDLRRARIGRRGRGPRPRSPDARIATDARQLEGAARRASAARPRL